jgi:uncharacterized protein (DUF952 family)
MILTDISTQALNVARLNLEVHGLQQKVELRRANLLTQLPGPFDLICANLPYIPTHTLDTLPVGKTEPRLALDGGADGLKLIKRLLKQAKNRLDTTGLMLLEIDSSQRNPLLLLAHKHFPSARIQVLQDFSGRDRCLEIEQGYLIFHLCQRQDWMDALQTGEYIADSLKREGFIHCSRDDQVTDVANRYYQAIPDMVILAIDPAKLISKVRWDKSGEEVYPHVYGPINLEAVCSMADICPKSDGSYQDIFGKMSSN